MTHFEWRRFCVDSKLCSTNVNASHADLIFRAVTRDAGRMGDTAKGHWKMLAARMNYERFRQGIALFSKELYPNDTRKKRMAKMRKHIFANAVNVPLAHSTNKLSARLGGLVDRGESEQHRDWRAHLEALSRSVDISCGNRAVSVRRTPCPPTPAPPAP